MLDCTKPMARTITNSRNSRCGCRILLGPSTRRTTIRTEHTRQIRQRPNAATDRPSLLWSLPQTPSREGYPRTDTAMVHSWTRNHGESHAAGSMGTNAIRRHHSSRILSSRPHGTMSRTLHHGQRIHRVRNHHDDPDARGTDMAEADWTITGILRLSSDSCVGLRQYLYGA